MADYELSAVGRFFASTLKWLKRLVILALFVVLLVLVVNFALSNTGQVTLEMAGWTMPPLKSSTLVLVPFILGGVIGLLVSLVLVVRLHMANSSLKRKLARRDAEIQKLRSSTLKGLTNA